MYRHRKFMSRTNMQIKKVNVKGPKKLFNMKECNLFMDKVFKNKCQTVLIDLIQAYFLMQKKRSVKNEFDLDVYKNKIFYQEYAFLYVKNYVLNMCLN
jgi:hypothetical protein